MYFEKRNRKKARVMHQKYFEGADRAGKLLAWQIKKKWNKALITESKVDGREILEAKDIKSNFVKFYENLYKKNKVKLEDFKNYLDNMNLASIPKDIRKELNKDVEVEEISEAIDAVNKNKSPDLMDSPQNILGN